MFVFFLSFFRMSQFKAYLELVLSELEPISCTSSSQEARPYTCQHRHGETTHQYSSKYVHCSSDALKSLKKNQWKPWFPAKITFKKKWFCFVFLKLFLTFFYKFLGGSGPLDNARTIPEWFKKKKKLQKLTILYPNRSKL